MEAKSTDMKKPIIFVGLDAATWQLILPWVKQDRLPGFKKLLQYSKNYHLSSTMPPITACAWHTMFTGLNPGKLGYVDFQSIDSNRQIQINSTQHLIGKYLWNRLSSQNKKVCIFNFPMSYTAHPVNGIMVSGFLSSLNHPEYTYPSSLKREFIQKFPQHRLVAKGKYHPFNQKKTLAYINSLTSTLQMRIEQSKWLLQKDSWDLFVTVLMEIDHAQHFFWEHLYNPSSPYYRVIFQMYRLCDQFIADLLQDYQQTHQIVVASDHGAGPSSSQLAYINVWLEKKGYLVYKKSLSTKLKLGLRSNLLQPQLITNAINRLQLEKILELIKPRGKNPLITGSKAASSLFLGVQDIDWNKTQAFSYGHYGGIFVLKNKSALIDQILHQLEADFAGTLTFIKKSTDLYQMKKLSYTIPDIQFLLGDGAITSTIFHPFAGHSVFQADVIGKSGEHRPDGILSIVQDTKKGTFSLEQADILDVYQYLSDHFNHSSADFQSVSKSIYI